MTENKKIEITLLNASKIEFIAERAWGTFLPDASEINDKIKLGEKFITLKAKNEQVYTLRIEDIQHMVETKFDEPEPMNGDKVGNVE